MSRASILDLPAEILSQILYIVEEESPAHFIAPLFTCRQLYRLTLPIIYHDLKFRYPCHPRTERLHRSLQSNPGLSLLVRSLFFDLRPRFPTGHGAGSIAVEDYAAVVDVLTRCRAVHTLKIWGIAFLPPEAQETFVEVVPGQVVDLSRWELLQHALRHLPTLRRIVMARDRDSTGYGLQCRFDCQMQGYEDLRALPGTGARALSAVRQRVCECCVTSQGSDGAVQRPTITGGAVYFSIAFGPGYTEEESAEEAVDFDLVYAWLRTRPHILRRIAFGSFKTPPLGTEFRATAWPNLHTVICPPYQVRQGWYGAYESPSAAVGRLLSPTVKTFVFDLTSYDQQHGAQLTDFGALEERWLRTFAETAAAPDRSTALRTIRVIFEPETYPYHDKWEVYPWDRIRQVQEDIRPLGLDLEYSTPTITREEYHDAWQRKQEWLASEEYQREMDRIIAAVARNRRLPVSGLDRDEGLTQE
ncbi:hypothetical protein ASPACDRAFT_39602 [Aspergillus aculeatus ATCC 16872]|uniref:F-box domain-containing protein n=1 Tax=Aspergillus aculeatus (strain ATCC 16872 / CBS 172.66 / WB 5094) TaxID=690307 RepID=A0A1L9X6R6_ASPA1|nr:uncharacterized protein ASPACDRAFT_39602 [Aspergillus aculeatus ATCC 16872]OJK03988.1 hypothetical protein ASPACDRAFT_39602 [Aspergillus aculeatus ATCC 16872]